MERNLLRMLTPLLFLALCLLPSKKADAQLGLFSPNLSAQELIEEVNVLRASNNLAPYEVDPILMKIAQTHADYVASTGVVTHFDASGKRPHQRALDAGYTVSGDLSLGGLLGESIHSGVNLSATDVITFWKGSTSDLNIMLSAEFKDTGAGMAIANGVTYYVLVAGVSDDTPVVISTPTISAFEAVISTAGAIGTEAVIVKLNTPLSNGEIFHGVQKNEALWSIAVAYGITVEQIKLLNGLATDEIFEGQTLLVQRPIPDTATPSPVATATFGIPTSTATMPVTLTATSTSTPIPRAPASLESGGTVVGIIVLIALLAAGLGALLGRKKVE